MATRMMHPQARVRDDGSARDARRRACRRRLRALGAGLRSDLRRRSPAAPCARPLARDQSRCRRAASSNSASAPASRCRSTSATTASSASTSAPTCSSAPSSGSARKRLANVEALHEMDAAHLALRRRELRRRGGDVRDDRGAGSGARAGRDDRASSGPAAGSSSSIISRREARPARGDRALAVAVSRRRSAGIRISRSSAFSAGPSCGWSSAGPRRLRPLHAARLRAPLRC